MGNHKGWWVVLDTSVVHGDFQLNTSRLNYLLRICRAATVKVNIPMVVVAELVANFGRGVAEARQKANSALNDLRKYSYDREIQSIEDSTRSLETHYEDWLVHRLEALEISIIDIPDISHEQVLRRYMSNKRPFSGKDFKGYKDTLIWETTLHLLHKYQVNVVLITGDQIFSASDGLHSDLATELSDRDFEPRSVILARSFAEATEVLDSIYGVKAKLYEEEWAAVPEDTLRADIPISNLVVDYLNDNEFLLKEELTGFSEVSVIELAPFKAPEVEFGYEGGGVWRIQGSIVLDLFFEAYDDDERTYNEMNFEVEIRFSMSFDYPNKNVRDIEIADVLPDI